MNVVLMYEGGAASGAFEDGLGGTWVAEAQRDRVPVADATGDTPLDAVMGLAQVLAAMLSTDRIEKALARVEEARDEAELSLTPAQIEAKERLAAKRAAADAELPPATEWIGG